MRRFPPPPNSHGGPSTPQAITTRSKESPMQFEFTTPRTFPHSSFSLANTPSNGGEGVGDDSMNGIEDVGEPARKRTSKCLINSTHCRILFDILFIFC